MLWMALCLYRYETLNSINLIKSFGLLFTILILLTTCSNVERKQGIYGEIDSNKITEAFAFCKKQKMDTTICFMVAMSIHSGKNRFFVWDFKNKKVLYSGLCCHGMGGGSTQATPVFSNVSGSYCTSLGKYKTGIRSYSQWGIHVHYKLHGLESTNSNAFARVVVLHSYDPVPTFQIYPAHLPMGWSLGCPVIDNDLMTVLDGMLKNRKSPVLLWIYQ